MIKDNLVDPVENLSFRNVLSLNDITNSVQNGCVLQV